jgi:hypothetical protein
MLAWDKLDREGMLPKGLSLSSPEEQPQGLEFLRRGLTYLSDMSDLGEATAAFRHELRIPEEFSEDELRRIFWILKNARWQEIDYREAIDVFTRLEGRGTLFANIPEEIADLMVQLAEVKPEDTVYCPSPVPFAWLSGVTKSHAKCILRVRNVPRFRTLLTFCSMAHSVSA